MIKPQSTGWLILLWFVFFLICFGLGYSTLNRYDPRETGGNVDAIQYYKIVEGKPQDASGHWRYRVLVPYFAKFFFLLSKGHIGSWNPVFFGLLVVNAIFCAASACLLVILNYQITEDYAGSLLGATLYLLNFFIINEQLAGLVDSGEGALTLMLTLTLIRSKWPLLPIIAILGAFAKETFLPLAIIFSLTWWRLDSFRAVQKHSRLIWLCIMIFAGLSAVVLLRSVLSDTIVWPWVILLSEKSHDNFVSNFLKCIVNQDLWYGFLWLLPLGVIKLYRLPKQWVISSVATAIFMLLLGIYSGSGGNVGRSIFNVIGPVLSLSTANLLVSIGSRSCNLY